MPTSTATSKRQTSENRKLAQRLGATTPAIDAAHLGRMTLGEKSLEKEVLELFDRQAAILLARMRDAPPKSILAFAHALKGSAQGIGAWSVASAAEAVEAAEGEAKSLAAAVDRLASAIGEARMAIAGLLSSR